MEYITSRGFALPESADDFASLLWFNLWRLKLWPYRELAVGDIRDLRGTVERENAAMGVFVTLEQPSGQMRTEAVTAGYYHSPGWDKDHPKIQILTIEALLDGATVEMPPQFGTFKQAPKAGRHGGKQEELGL